MLVAISAARGAPRGWDPSSVQRGGVNLLALVILVCRIINDPISRDRYHGGDSFCRTRPAPPGHHTPGVEAIRKAGPHHRLIAVRFSFAAHVCLLYTLA